MFEEKIVKHLNNKQLKSQIRVIIKHLPPKKRKAIRKHYQSKNLATTAVATGPGAVSDKIDVPEVSGGALVSSKKENNKQLKSQIRVIIKHLPPKKRKAIRKHYQSKNLATTAVATGPGAVSDKIDVPEVSGGALVSSKKENNKQLKSQIRVIIKHLPPKKKNGNQKTLPKQEPSNHCSSRRARSSFR